MVILNKYIGKSILSSILLVLMILVGIESFLLLANELKDIGKGNFSFFQALSLLPLTLPTNIYELFPIAVLIGSLIGLGKLASQSELIVMSAVGISYWQIIRALLFAALISLIIALIVGEGIAPHAQHLAKNLKSIAMSDGKTLAIESGIWFRDGNNFIFVRDVMKNNQLSDITRYQFDEKHQLKLISHAQKGIHRGDGWYFNNVSQTRLLPKKIMSWYYPLQKWNITLDKRLIGITKLYPDQMTLQRLYSYIHFRHNNELGTGAYEFAFWKRIMQPFATLVMIFLAVPCIFGPLRTVPMGLRIVAGVIMGFSFYLLNQFLGPVSQVYQISAFLVALVPTAIFAMIGAFLLFLKT